MRVGLAQARQSKDTFEVCTCRAESLQCGRNYGLAWSHCYRSCEHAMHDQPGEC